LIKPAVLADNFPGLFLYLYALCITLGLPYTILKLFHHRLDLLSFRFKFSSNEALFISTAIERNPCRRLQSRYTLHSSSWKTSHVLPIDYIGSSAKKCDNFNDYTVWIAKIFLHQVY
jgi:hypothetical protein